MIHYHGTPITPLHALRELAGRHFCVSFARPEQVRRAHELGQSVMLDNGAFSVWRRGEVIDWDDWARWVDPWLDHRTTWCVLPDLIDGGEDENDELLDEWKHRFDLAQAAPVWHLHESLERLERLAYVYPRVCFGSSGAYARVGTPAWHRRIAEALDAVADEDGRVPNIHMLRGMSLAGGPYPFASADSTDVAQNHNRPQNTPGAMAARWDALQTPARWRNPGTQLELKEDTCAA